MEDKQIVELYWARQENAISETDKKYGRYCYYIANGILCSDEDSKEVVNDTYLKLWNTIPTKRPEALKPYVGMISSQTALDRYEARGAAKRGSGQIPAVLDELAECIPDSSTCDDIGDNIALSDAMNRFIASLPKKTRNIFLKRYFYLVSVTDVAKEYSMSESSVGMLMLRTRKKLKHFLQKEGF